ncbi:MAG: DUF4160 domain-containing protein [Desulfovibrionaceae bacterium]|jgi:hypothetical protein|nr:DUF4160 domain-containing protein [Desulfovibrionaceae bacterium]
MGKIHSQENWLIRVQGNEHPPVHVHVLHPDGRAVLYLDGTVINNHVPASVISDAGAWVATHEAVIRAEWDRMGNPPSR